MQFVTCADVLWVAGGERCQTGVKEPEPSPVPDPAVGALIVAGRSPLSVEAISWALNLAPVPADRGGQPSSACKYLSVATLVRCTGLSERTVRTCLDRLEAQGIIRTCDPDIVSA